MCDQAMLVPEAVTLPGADAVGHYGFRTLFVRRPRDADEVLQFA